MVDGYGDVVWNQLAPFIPENPQGSPITGEHEFRPTIHVEVGEHGTADESDAGKSATGLGIEAQAAMIVAQQGGRSPFGIAARHDAPADEQVEIAIAVEVP